MIVRKINHEENKKIGPSGAYTGQGPQASMNIHVTCMGQNTALCVGVVCTTKY